MSTAGSKQTSRPKAAAGHNPALLPMRRGVRTVPLLPHLMIAYCATSLMQVPLTGSGIVWAGQQKPHDVTCEGSQQAPLSVMPSLLEQIGTQLPSKFCWPAGQAFPSSDGGQMTPSGLACPLMGGTCGAQPVLLQMQLTPTADVPAGQSHVS